VGGGPTRIKVVVLAFRGRRGAVAVRRGAAAAWGTGDVRAAQGAGERVGDGEGQRMGVQDGQMG